MVLYSFIVTGTEYTFAMLMDEVYGQENCRNEIVWLYHRFGLGTQKNYTRAHDNILWYVKSSNSPFNLDSSKSEFLIQTKPSQMFEGRTRWIVASEKGELIPSGYDPSPESPRIFGLSLLPISL